MHLVSARHHTEWKLKRTMDCDCSVNTLKILSVSLIVDKTRKTFTSINGRGISVHSISWSMSVHLPTYHVQQQRATRRALGVWEPWRDVDCPTTKTELTTTEASHVHTTCIAKSSSISTSIYINLKHTLCSGEGPKSCRKLHGAI